MARAVLFIPSGDFLYLFKIHFYAHLTAKEHAYLYLELLAHQLGERLPRPVVRGGREDEGVGLRRDR